MLGDYYTLNPLCKSAEADKLGLTIPIHRRLSELFPQKVIIMRTQYRLSTNICQLLNQLAYRGLVKSNSELDKDISLIGPAPTENVPHLSIPWLKEVRQP